MNKKQVKTIGNYIPIIQQTVPGASSLPPNQSVALVLNQFFTSVVPSLGSAVHQLQLFLVYLLLHTNLFFLVWRPGDGATCKEMVTARWCP